MAQKIEVVLVDDLDGSTAANTVKFGLDGQTYEIDLNSKNEERLRKALHPYLSKARRQKRTYNKRKQRQDAA